jgi:xanthine dehydrogenase accessory factor
MTERAAALARSGTPFVQATVVRAQEPSSARPGDRAIILPDGSIEGFVGGHCATGSVRTAALGVLESGESLLLRVLPEAPEGTTTFPETPGASIVVNPCLSGGAMEIYLEPLLPSPVLHLVGASPAAEAIAALAPGLGFVLTSPEDGASPAGATTVVVCTHGDEAGPVRAALDAGVRFVGVVCSRTRGEALLAELGLTEDERQRVHTHVGVEIGARTAPELALSVMAEVVRAIRVDGLSAAEPAVAPERPGQAIDPVCGMTVTIGPDTLHAVVDGTDYWFCAPGCRKAFLAEHAS